MRYRRSASRPLTGIPFHLSSRLLCDSSNAKEHRELFAALPPSRHHDFEGSGSLARSPEAPPLMAVFQVQAAQE
jgi:hypothetical protein